MSNRPVGLVMVLLPSHRSAWFPAPPVVPSGAAVAPAAALAAAGCPPLLGLMQGPPAEASLGAGAIGGRRTPRSGSGGFLTAPQLSSDELRGEALGDFSGVGQWQ